MSEPTSCPPGGSLIERKLLFTMLIFVALFLETNSSDQNEALPKGQSGREVVQVNSSLERPTNDQTTNEEATSQDADDETTTPQPFEEAAVDSLTNDDDSASGIIQKQNQSVDAKQSPLQQQHRSASTLEPIYFGRYPQSQPPLPPPPRMRHTLPVGAQRGPTVQYESAVPWLQSNPESSFYSFGEPIPAADNEVGPQDSGVAYPAPESGRIQNDESLQPLLLQSLGLELAPPEGGSYEQVVGGRQQASSSKFNVGGGQSVRRLPLAPPPRHNLIQQTRYAAAAAVATRPVVNPSIGAVRRPSPRLRPPLPKKSAVLNAALGYRSSLLNRPKPINLSSLLEPGQALLTKQMSPSSRPSVETVSVEEIEDLLTRLKPLAVSESERPEWERPVAGEVGGGERYKGGANQEDQEDRDEEDEREDREEVLEALSPLQQPIGGYQLPTAHLFGGSVRGTNESRIASSPATRGSQPHPPTVALPSSSSSSLPSSGSNNANDDDYLLKSLKDFGAKLDNNKESQRGDRTATRRRHISTGFFEPENRSGPRSWTPPGGGAASSPHNERLVAQSSQSSVPVDVLVDHLLSNSRLASFGDQHNDVAGGGGGQLEDDDDDDDEEEEAEGREDGDAAADESSLRPATTAAFPVSMLQNATAPYSSVMSPNKTYADSWIPLESVAIKSGKPPRRREDDDDDDVRKDGTKNDEPQVSEATRSKRRKGGDRQRRKKSKRAGGGSSGLIIGGKRLSRTDLVRLIGVLNKMASKREPSKERDASRKLLRFLIKLALEDYRRSKLLNEERSLRSGSTNDSANRNTNDANDSVRDLLRSILMSPDNGTSQAAPNSARDSTPLELRPVRVELGEGNEGDSGRRSKGTGVKLGDEGSRLEPERADDEQRRERLDTKPNGVSLSKLSDDLEQYFDGDFFEDLADKAVVANSSEGIQIVRGNVLPPERGTRRRKSRVYKMPVAIYDKQQMEAADEDDADLDHVHARLPQDYRKPVRRGSPPTRKPSGHKSNRKGFKEIRATRPRRRRARQGKGQRKRGLKDKDSDRDEEEEAEDEDEGTVKGERRESRVKEEPSERRPPARAGHRSPEESGEDKEDEEEDTTGEQIEDDNAGKEMQAPEQHEKPRERVSGGGTKSLTTTSRATQRDDASSRDSGETASQRGRVTLPKKRGRRRRKRGKRKKKGKDTGGKTSDRQQQRETSTEVDLDSRDEIPAPIMASYSKANSSLLNSDGRTNFSSKTSEPSKVQKLNYKSSNDDDDDESNSAKKSPKTMKRTAPKKTKTMTTPPKKEKRRRRKVAVKKEEGEQDKEDRGRSRPDRSVRRRRPSRDPDEPPSEEDSEAKPQPPGEEEDADYYNEGTSYSQICDDDGKCQVKVQSTSPKLSQAIKSRNKPAIVKQLGGWMRDEQTD